MSFFVQAADEGVGSVTNDYDVCFREKHYSEKSLAFLEKAGIDIEKHKHQGIKQADFFQYLSASPLTRMPGIQWISFQGLYDFAYIIKGITKSCLPQNMEDFMYQMRAFFPFTFDVKKMMKQIPYIYNGQGLKTVSNTLRVSCDDAFHQAGYDSLITYACCIQLFQMGIVTMGVEGLPDSY